MSSGDKAATIFGIVVVVLIAAIIITCTAIIQWKQVQRMEYEEGSVCVISQEVEDHNPETVSFVCTRFEVVPAE